MKRQYTISLRVQARRRVQLGRLAMQMFVLLIVGRRDFREQASHHLNDVLDLHVADLVLRALVSRGAAGSAAVPDLREGAHVLAREALDVLQVPHFDLCGACLPRVHT